MFHDLFLWFEIASKALKHLPTNKYPNFFIGKVLSSSLIYEDQENKYCWHTLESLCILVCYNFIIFILEFLRRFNCGHNPDLLFEKL